MCLKLISNIANKTDVQTLNIFFQQFFIPILQGVFFIIMDLDHKAGFKTQLMLLMRMFYFVQPADETAPKIQGPIYQPDQAQAGTSSRKLVSCDVWLQISRCFHVYISGQRALDGRNARR